MQRLNKRPHDSEEPHDTALIPYQASSSSVARAEALLETALTKRHKTGEDQVVAGGRGHTFDRIIACDNARVQNGDTYNISYHRVAEPESKEDDWPKAMAALRFPQMEVRRQTVKDAHTGTCEWIFEEPEYRSWCDTDQTPLHHGFMWIKGKPGAGKSTLMKFILDSTEQQSALDETVISFFFNARGDILERSLEGMYRQLLHQLLTRVARLHSTIPALEVSNLEPLGWPRRLLEEIFKRFVLGLEQELVSCFIDALDECTESEVRDLVEFFEDLGNITAKKGICFRVCFSSRHYPNVSLEKCQHFMLDGQNGHQQDISAYIESKLRLRRSTKSEQIRTAVLKRAEGVFLWVVLVVKRLNQDHDRGNVHNLQGRLDEVPDGLDDLFRDILRITDNDDGLLIQIMQWVMYARRPLACEELYFGVRTGTLSDGDLEPWDHDEITSEVMDRFIVNCSRGLVESTREQYPRMQFIHESVRDYLFGGGLGLLAPAISNNLAGASHDYLKHSCLKVLTSRVIDAVCFSTHTLETPNEYAHQDAGHVMSPFRFPLLGYASSVVDHAELAFQHGVNQDNFLAVFPLQVWNQMHQKRGFSRLYEPANSKTQMLINAHAYGLLEHELRPGYPLLTPAEHVHAIEIVLQHSNWDRKIETCDLIDIVLKRGVVADISNDDQASLIHLAVCDPRYYRDRQHLHNLLSPLFNGGMRLHSDESFRSVLSQALLDRYPFIQDLLDHEAHFGPFTTDSLHNAVNRGSTAAVKTLLDSGADFNACMMATASSRTMHGGCDDSFLDVTGHYSCLKLASFLKLAENDAFGFAVSRGIYEGLAEHLTAFQYAALIGREEVIRLFLARAADPAAASNECHEFEIPMYLAALLGHHAIVSHLLKDARWVISPDSGIWQRALCAAAYAGHNETLKILLADHPHMQARGAPPPSAHEIRQLPPGGCVSLASYEEDMLAMGLLPDHFEQAILGTIYAGREETLKTLVDFLDASSLHFCSRGRRTLSYALGIAESRREGFPGLARILRERGATVSG
jgi:hypothetical protein